MKRKRRTPLQALMVSVKCASCADGSIRITPGWRDKSPGVITRLYAARQLQALINRQMITSIELREKLRAFYANRDKGKAQQLELVELAILCGQSQKDTIRFGAIEYLERYLKGREG